MNAAQRPSTRPTNAEVIETRHVTEAARQLFELGWIPPRYRQAVAEAEVLANEAEAADLEAFLRRRS